MFRLMGRDYDAAVMGGGLCGFMLGTTANAMANMEALVDRYGPAPRAFLVVPMVGAFFIDFINARHHHGLSEPMELTRDDAWALLTEYTKSESLLKHALAVEAAVRGYARTFGEDEEAGASSRCCTTSTTSAGRRSDDHPFRGSEILREKGYPEWVIRAILSHAGLQRRAARQRCSRRRCSPATSWRLHHRGVAGAAEQERARPRGVVGREADEGQGVRARREARGSARGRRAARAAARTSTSPTSSGSCASRPTRSGCGEHCRARRFTAEDAELAETWNSPSRSRRSSGQGSQTSSDLLIRWDRIRIQH